MVKVYSPDPESLAAALAGRLDLLEQRFVEVAEVRSDVAALGHGVTDLTGQVRRLAAGGRPSGTGPGTSPDTATTGTTVAGPAVGDDGQPVWVTVTDPVVATQLLVEVEGWSRAVLGPLGAAPGTACWPLHPAVVTELLALAAEHRAAYAAEGPTGVSEWLARWLPGASARIGQVLHSCAQDHGHYHRGRLYEVGHLDLEAVARWWADTHGEHPDAVQAFALSPAL